MTASSWDRSRRLPAASVLTVFAVVAAAVVLALGVGVPQAWWPHTGRAFAADARPKGDDPCGLIVGPGKVYCERGAARSASAGRPDVAGGEWRLVSAGAGMGALVVWRLRGTAGQRRR
jgi:hypothetical protein